MFQEWVRAGERERSVNRAGGDYPTPVTLCMIDRHDC
jgi:hypothetical protein